jgi:hypothetical protein
MMNSRDIAFKNQFILDVNHESLCLSSGGNLGKSAFQMVMPARPEFLAGNVLMEINL